MWSFLWQRATPEACLTLPHCSCTQTVPCRRVFPCDKILRPAGERAGALGADEAAAREAERAAAQPKQPLKVSQRKIDQVKVRARLPVFQAESVLFGHG